VEKKYLVLLIDALIKEAIGKYEFSDNLRGPRGFKGKDGQDFDLEIHGEELKNFILNNLPKKIELTEDQIKSFKGEKGDTGEPGAPGRPGRDGKDFSFEDNKQEIESILTSHISDIRDTLKLRFSDLSEEEKESLRGSRGADGKAFNLSENIEEISSLIHTYIDQIKGDFKLKFSDLSEEEVSLLRGPRGQRGKQGKDFVFEENKDKIIDILVDYISGIKSELKLTFSDLSEEEKSSLKLKFEDLSDEDKRSLKGARGQRGKQGIQGEKGDRGETGDRGSIWSESRKDPETFEWTSGGDIHLNTNTQDLFIFGKDSGWRKIANIRGARGVPGIPGVVGERGLPGRDGKDGKDAKNIVDVETIQRENKVSLKFIFSDGSEVISDPFEIPESKIIKNVFMAGLGVGSSSGGTGQDGKSAYEIAVENGFVGTEQDWLDSLVGAQGPQGDPGDSAYQVAVNNGFVGTEQDWLDSLVGPQGPQGDPGPQGPPGTGSGSCLAVTDEGNPVTDCAKAIDFVGANIEVTSTTVMDDWPSLDVVDYIGTWVATNPGYLKVSVKSEAEKLEDLKEYAETISSVKLLTAVNSTDVKVASTDTEENATVLGMAISAGLAGAAYKIHLFGKISDPSFNFPVNDLLFLGDNGSITNSLPTGPYLTRVGYSLGSGAIFLSPTTPIEL
jgi:hypothetical protein